MNKETPIIDVTVYVTPYRRIVAVDEVDFLKAPEPPATLGQMTGSPIAWRTQVLLNDYQLGQFIRKAESIGLSVRVKTENKASFEDTDWQRTNGVWFR